MFLPWQTNSTKKTLVYSKCLKTLDLIEGFLKSKDWGKQVKSLDDQFPNVKLGGFKKNRDFLRIDGSTDPGKRGNLVNDFNGNSNFRVFLISPVAGGLGINLVSILT